MLIIRHSTFYNVESNSAQAAHDAVLSDAANARPAGITAAGIAAAAAATAMRVGLSDRGVAAAARRRGEEEEERRPGVSAAEWRMGPLANVLGPRPRRRGRRSFRAVSYMQFLRCLVTTISRLSIGSFLRNFYVNLRLWGLLLLHHRAQARHHCS